MNTYVIRTLPLAISLALGCSKALADDADLPAVTISATPLEQDADSLATPVTVLDGSRLFQRVHATLGDTLRQEPGINADTFGGGASRPVIRGQGSPRVTTLSDGSRLMDASDISPDHAITTEPMLARRIEVLRGPATLLHGGGAIGGVVNVLDDKIPETLPRNGLEGFVGLRAGTAAHEKALAAGVTAAASDRIAIHFEGSTRQADDYAVPHWTSSRLAGSQADGSSGSLGLSWLADQGFLGLAYTVRRDSYGLPGHDHEHENCTVAGNSLLCPPHNHPHVEEEAPLVKLESERLDLRGEYYEPMAGIDRIRLRASHTNYHHDEIEEGEIGTTFRNQGADGRIEVEHAPLAGWTGVVGLQHARNDFRASGEESFLPRSTTQNTGLFVLEHYDLRQDLHLELGARQEWQSVTPDNNQPCSSLSGSSLSAATTWQFQPGWASSLSLTRSQRLPSAQELYADGIHLASNTYELGDPDLGRETSHNAELGLKKTEGATTLALNLFYNRVDNYTFADTLDQHENFRLVRYVQRNAEFHGAEAEVRHQLNDNLAATMFGDYVRGKLTDGDNLPRIPAARVGLRLEPQWQALHGELEYYRTARQNDIAGHETATPGHDMLNAGISYSGKLDRQQRYDIYLRGENLLNKLAYNHTSFIADTAPLPGRNLSAGVRLSF